MRLRYGWFYRLFTGIVILLFLEGLVSASFWEGFIGKKKVVYESSPEEDAVVKELFYEGLKLKEDEKYKEAIEKFKTIVEKYPNNPDAPTAQAMIGGCWMEAGMYGVDEAYDRMDEAYEKLKKLYRGSLAYYFAWAELSFFGKDKKQALIILKRLSKQEMTPLLEGLVWYSLGGVYRNFAEFRQEREWYRKFMEKYPDHPYAPMVQYHIAESYVVSPYGYEEKRKKDPENLEMGIREGEKVVRNYPRTWWAGKAQVDWVAGGYHTLHNYPRAIEEYQKALDNYDLDVRDPYNHRAAWVLKNMALCYNELGKWKEAIKCYERMIYLYTEGKYAKYQKKYPGGPVTEARERIEKIKKKHPSESELIAMTKEPKERIYALEMLVDLNKEKYLPLLVKALIEELENGVGDERGNAALDLGKIGDESAVPSLIKALKDKKDSVLQWEAAEALGRIGDRRAIPALVEALTYQSKSVQREAAMALGKMGSNAGLSHILWILQHDEDWWDRRDAADILGNIGDKSVMPYLKKALKDKNKEVREAAKKAIEKIKGR